MKNSDSDSESECFESAEEDLSDDGRRYNKSKPSRNLSKYESEFKGIVGKTIMHDEDFPETEEKEVENKSMTYRKRPERVKRPSNTSSTGKDNVSKKISSNSSIYNTDNKIASDAFFQDFANNLSKNINKSLHTLHQTSSNIKGLVFNSFPVSASNEKEMFSYEDETEISQTLNGRHHTSMKGMGFNAFPASSSKEQEVFSYEDESETSHTLDGRQHTSIKGLGFGSGYPASNEKEMYSFEDETETSLTIDDDIDKMVYARMKQVRRTHSTEVCNKRSAESRKNFDEAIGTQNRTLGLDSLKSIKEFDDVYVKSNHKVNSQTFDYEDGKSLNKADIHYTGSDCTINENNIKKIMAEFQEEAKGILEMVEKVDFDLDQNVDDYLDKFSTQQTADSSKIHDCEEIKGNRFIDDIDKNEETENNSERVTADRKKALPKTLGSTKNHKSKQHFPTFKSVVSDESSKWSEMKESIDTFQIEEDPMVDEWEDFNNKIKEKKNKEPDCDLEELKSTLQNIVQDVEKNRGKNKVDRTKRGPSIVNEGKISCGDAKSPSEDWYEYDFKDNDGKFTTKQENKMILRKNDSGAKKPGKIKSPSANSEKYKTLKLSGQKLGAAKKKKTDKEPFLVKGKTLNQKQFKNDEGNSVKKKKGKPNKDVKLESVNQLMTESESQGTLEKEEIVSEASLEKEETISENTTEKEELVSQSSLMMKEIESQEFPIKSDKTVPSAVPSRVPSEFDNKEVAEKEDWSWDNWDNLEGDKVDQQLNIKLEDESKDDKLDEEEWGVGWDNWDVMKGENLDGKIDNKSEDGAKDDVMDEDRWGGWDNFGQKQDENQGNWNLSSWSVSLLLNKATVVTQGISNALEAGLGTPDPETLTRLEKKEREKKREIDTNIKPKGITSLVSGVTSKIVGHSKIHELGSKMISGGLDTLETVGKKTMEVLQEGDPGLKYKRALLMGGSKPSLSQVLKEAREKADREERKIEEKEIAKKCHFESLFDDFQGMVHLEALEMLSMRCEIKLDQMKNAMNPQEQKDLEGVMGEVEQLCSLEEVDMNPGSLIDFKLSLIMTVEPLRDEISINKIIQVYEDVEKWLKASVDVKPTTMVAYQKFVSTLAELTAAAVHQFHKAAELLSIKECRKTVEEADTLSKMTELLCLEISRITQRFLELFKRDLNTSDIKTDKIIMVTKNSTSYIKQAFTLLVPVVQVGAAS